MKQRRRWLRRLTWLAGVLLFAGGGLYAWATRPAALRAQLISALESSGIIVRGLGDIGYRPLSGLTFHDARLDVTGLLPASKQLPEESRDWFVEYGVVARPLIDVLLGRPTPRRIDLNGATINFVVDEWRSGGTGPATTMTLPDPASLPEVRIRAAAIRRFTPRGGEMRLRRHVQMDVHGYTAESDHSPGVAYHIDLFQTGGPSADHLSGKSRQPASIHLEWGVDSVYAESSWLDVGELQSLLPPSVWDRLNDVLVTGRARLVRWTRSSGSAVLELALDDARVSIPIEPRDRVAPKDRFLNLTGVGGRFVYERSDDRTIRFDLGGDVRGAPVELSGRANGLASLTTLAEGGFEQYASEIAGGLSVELKCRDLVLPEISDYPEFVRSEVLPGPARDLFKKYLPSGPVDFSLRLARAAGEQRVQYDGVLEPRGGGCRYEVFPYDITDASGAARFSNAGVILDGLSGRHGSARITVNGRLNDSTKYAGFTIDVRGDNIALDHDLYEALPKSYKGLWRDAAPVGMSDMHAVIRRAQGSPEIGRQDPRVRIDTRLLSGSVSYEGRRLTQADGLIRIEEGELNIHDFHAWLDDSALRASGTVSNSGGAGSRASDVLIEVANLDLARDAASDPDAADAHIRFAGRGDVWGRTVKTADGDSAAYVLRLTGGTLTGFDAGEAWQVDSGWVNRGELLQDVMGLKAHRGGAQLSLHGQLPVEADSTLPMSLSIKCGPGDIAALLRTLVPPRWVSVRDALGLAGSGNVEIQFDRKREPDGSMRSEAVIDLTAERMKPTPIPLDLRQIAGRVRVSDDGFTVEDVQAQYGAAGRFGVSGVGGWEAGDAWSRIDVDARDIDLTTECVAAMPGPLSQLLKRMAASGRINTNLGRLRLESRGTDHWDINGTLGFSDASLDLGLPVEQFQGQLSGAIRIRPEAPATLDADFTIDEGLLGGRAIRRWEGHMERGDGESVVRLTDIRGRIHNGEVNGEASINPETGAYELAITLHELNFAGLMSGADGERADSKTGIVSGHVFVRGQGGDVATRAGGGELRIAGASLLHSRVTASVVEAQRESKRPVATTIEQAELRFAWDGNLLRFNRVDLHTSSRRLIGEGSWNTDTGEISFTLIGASREDALRLPLLTDLLELAGRELVQYRISGTADNPKTSIEPLHALTGPVKRLLRGG